MCAYVLWNDAPVVRGIMHRLVRNIHKNEGLSNSEKEFFMSIRDLKKNYLKPANAKRLSL